MFSVSHLWIAIIAPFISFLLITLCLQFICEKVSAWVATLTVAFSAGWSLWTLFDFLQGGENGSLPWQMEWLRFSKAISINMGILVDSQSLLLLVIVTLISLLVHIYSLGYMAEEKGLARYFALLNFFTFSMVGLVMAPNIFQTFVFWELVGASSFFLIGFYYQKPAAVAASKKAFIVTRFADLGFLIGLLLLGWEGYQLLSQSGGQLAGAQFAHQEFFSVFDFSFLLNSDVVNALPSPRLTLALILIFGGACGKSAMFPLHIWLPDAMEGPTPVSALIHAATMVVAGVYLIGRLHPLFAMAPLALNLVLYVGTFTALFAATIAVVQDDIKRILAYSTLSQLGYMMMTLGLATGSSGDGLAISHFHLFTHAFFKALLFLGAGSVIHAVHSNSIWQMGGIMRKMPVTHFCFLVATLAIAGIPPFAGFFSKDEILMAAFHRSHLVFLVALFTAGLTAFYMFRLYFVAFLGKGATPASEQAHESPPSMLIPMLLLAAASLGAGFIPIEKFLKYQPTHQANHFIPFLAVGVAFCAIAWSWWRYRPMSPTITQRETLTSDVLPLRLIRNKFYIDELYTFVTKQIVFRWVAEPVAWFDRHIVDGTMDLTAWLTRQSGTLLRYLQTGQLQMYALCFCLGILLLLFFMI